MKINLIYFIFEICFLKILSIEGVLKNTLFLFFKMFIIGGRKKFPKFNQFTDIKKKIKLKAGMKFASSKVFREALKQYAIENGIDFAI